MNAPKGVIVALIGYELAMQSTLDGIVDEIQRALVFLDNWCQERGASGLYIAGHSAGAHLAAMGMLRMDMELTSLKGLFLLSGIYDLEPLIGTYINEPLRLTVESARRNSPELMCEELVKKCGEVQVTVVVADNDPPVFKENSHRMYMKLCQFQPKKNPVFLIIPGEDHFTMIERLDEPNFLLTQMFLAWIQQG